MNGHHALHRLGMGLVLMLAATACAQTLYVAPAGNDHNPGTRVLPLASLAGARERIRELRERQPEPQPVTVLVAAGRYRLREPLLLDRRDGGTAPAPVVYRADSGARPVFSGGYQITGFRSASDGYWTVQLPPGEPAFEQLFVNGHRVKRAQWPNNGFFYPVRVTETMRNGQAMQKISVTVAQARLFNALSDAAVKQLVVTFYHKWNCTRKKVLRYSAKDTAFYISGCPMQSWNPLSSQSAYRIENARAALDSAGEWYLDGRTLYYQPLSGEEPASTVALAPVLTELVRLTRLSYLRLEGLAFEGTGYRMPEGGEEPQQAAATIPAVIVADEVTSVSLTNCEIAHIGTNAIWFQRDCLHSTIAHCYLHDLGAGGIKIGSIVQNRELTSFLTIDNNIIRSGGKLFPEAPGIILFNAADNRITHNEIADFRYTGISVGWIWGYDPSPTKRNTIAFNHIRYLGWGEMSDLGGIYTLGRSGGTLITRNVIDHIYSVDYGGWGLYTDEGSSGITLTDNVVYACKTGGFHQHYGERNVISNNVFALELHEQLAATKAEDHVSFTFKHNLVYTDHDNFFGGNWAKLRIEADSNCYWDTRKTPVLLPAGESYSIVADPGFADPVSGDFGLRNTTVSARVGFKPFDAGQAGVYGDPSWKQLALFPPELAAEFDRIVSSREASGKRAP